MRARVYVLLMVLVAFIAFVPGGVILAQQNSGNQVSEGKVKSQLQQVQQSTKLNINRASKSDLEKLPGIGPTIAERIVNYREEHGAFKSIEDLKNVKGIGDKKFEALKDLITVE